MSSQTPDALAEGRRIYIGTATPLSQDFRNLHYVLKPNDIEEMLISNDFGDFENIHVSIDPVSGRNPGYCFVEFVDKETADRALRSLSVSLRGRQLKIGPCEPKKRGGHEGNPNFQRWGDWSPNKAGAGSAGHEGTNASGSGRASDGANHGGGASLQGNRAAIDHFDEMIDNFKGRRLYVGGLTRMIDQEQNIEEIREIFAGHNPEAIGKRITPHESTRAMKGNYHYCFVDFRTVQEAQAAIQALDGTAYKGGRLKVNMANRFPDHLNPRRSDGGSGGSGGNGGRDGERPSWGSRGARSDNSNSQRTGTDSSSSSTTNARGEPGSRPHYSEGRARALASMDWRKKAPAATASEE